ncbi:hypothetical protein [Streptomyces mirabilis]
MTDTMPEITPDANVAAIVTQQTRRESVLLTGDMHEDTQAVLNTIRRGNVDGPSVFVTAGDITRLGTSDQGTPVIKRHVPASFSQWTARYTQWQKPGRRRGEIVNCLPPAASITSVMATADAIEELPKLERVVQVPFFTRTRTLAAVEGYHEESRAWYQPSLRFEVPRVSECPSDSQVEAARSLILDDLLVDFPFASEGDRAGAVAMLLEPFVKDVISGNTPLHLIEASTQGTGKTKLVENCLAVGLGCRPIDVPGKPLAFDEAEIRKNITTDLMSGAPVVFFDNVSHAIKSPSLAQVLTGSTWTDRKLGGNENAELKIRCSWVLTSNNAKYNKDVARRISLIRLDLSARPDVPNSVCQHPETRTGFKHGTLEGWVTDHQGRLVWACLTLVQNWLADGGQPWSGDPLGSFESWSMTTGGILEAAGIRGFLENRASIKASGADDEDDIARFLEMWWKTHADNAVTPGDLAMANQDGGDTFIKLDAKKVPAVAMGYWLKEKAGQVIEGYHFAKTGRKWTLSQRDGDQ